jgi:hypothetical protein
MADSAGKKKILAILRFLANLDGCLDAGYALFNTSRNLDRPLATCRFQG